MNLIRTGSPTSQPPPVGPHEPTAGPDYTACLDETRSDRASSLSSPDRQRQRQSRWRWTVLAALLPGAENADEAGVEDADELGQEHPTAGVCDGVFIGEVSSFVGKVPVSGCGCPGR